MNGILRQQWGWDGFVVSDYDAWANILGTHHFTKDMQAAAAVGINAGLDQEGGGTRAISQLQAAITSGATTVAHVEMAFRRLMRMRIRLGMLDPPLLNPYYILGKENLQTAKATALNRRAAAEGMVLLKNDAVKGKGDKPLLPLDASVFVGHAGSVLVAGPIADNGNNTFGNYACDWGNCSTNVTSIFGGLRFADTGLSHGEVRYIPGCATTNCSGADVDFAPAVAAAATAQLSVVVLGTLGWDRLNPGDNPNPNAYEREGHDRTSIALAGQQYDLATALAKTGTPLLCVLIHGGSLKLGSLLDDCTAIVDTWFPGQQGGAGFADLIFGKASAGGRSPQTYYRDDSELPKLGNMDVYASNEAGTGSGTTCTSS